MNIIIMVMLINTKYQLINETKDDKVLVRSFMYDDNRIQADQKIVEEIKIIFKNISKLL